MLKGDLTLRLHILTADQQIPVRVRIEHPDGTHRLHRVTGAVMGRGWLEILISDKAVEEE